MSINNVVDTRDPFLNQGLPVREDVLLQWPDMCYCWEGRVDHQLVSKSFLIGGRRLTFNKYNDRECLSHIYETERPSLETFLDVVARTLKLFPVSGKIDVTFGHPMYRGTLRFRPNPHCAPDGSNLLSRFNRTISRMDISAVSIPSMRVDFASGAFMFFRDTSMTDVGYIGDAVNPHVAGHFFGELSPDSKQAFSPLEGVLNELKVLPKAAFSKRAEGV